MSNEALSWAFSLQIKPATVKFVLVAMADKVDKTWTFYQSVSEVCERTSLNRKTVISAIQTLSEMGIIEDTGHRNGETGRVTIYRLNGGGNGTENGTIKQSQKRDHCKGDNSPVFTRQWSQKRYHSPYIPNITQEEKEGCTNVVTTSGRERTLNGSAFSIILKDQTFFSVSHEHLEDLRSTFPLVDVDQQMREIVNWNRNNENKRKTRRGIRRHITSWLGGEQDKAEDRRRKQQSAPRASTNRLESFRYADGKPTSRRKP